MVRKFDLMKLEGSLNMFNTLITVIIFLFIFPPVWILWTYFIGAGWQPTSRRVVKKMLNMAELKPEDALYDLGSGDGRILKEACKAYGTYSVGLEADPLRVLWSRLNLRFSGLSDVSHVTWGNFFNYHIGDASVVTIFLWRGTNERLKAKFQEELKPGTRVVSYYWKIEGWKPRKIDEEEKIYLYVVC